MDRASDCGSEGCEFESHQARYETDKTLAFGSMRHRTFNTESSVSYFKMLKHFDCQNFIRNFEIGGNLIEFLDFDLSELKLVETISDGEFA